jgi:hypothetical protein
MLVLITDAMVFLQTYYFMGRATVPCSLWCATLFRDDHTAVDAGNGVPRETFMVGNENKSRKFCSSLPTARV